MPLSVAARVPRIQVRDGVESLLSADGSRPPLPSCPPSLRLGCPANTVAFEDHVCSGSPLSLERRAATRFAAVVGPAPIPPAGHGGAGTAQAPGRRADVASHLIKHL